MVSSNEDKEPEVVVDSEETSPEDEEVDNHRFYPFDNDMNLGIQKRIFSVQCEFNRLLNDNDLSFNANRTRFDEILLITLNNAFLLIIHRFVWHD